ncbi:MAG: ECF-type sigma factor [Planctomycetota bacterium]|jgi:hypothetical protein
MRRILAARPRRLAREDGIKADIVKLGYFAGLILGPVAEITGISRATACRYWSYARDWLFQDISVNEGTR